MRHQLQLVAIFFIVIGGGYWGYLQLFEKEVATPGLRLLEVDGNVEMQRGTSGAVPLSVDAELLEQDTLRVGENGSAVIGIGEGTRVQVEAGSTLQVLGVQDDGILLELEEGRVQAKVQPGKARVEIGHGGQRAGTGGGAFSMSVSAADELLVRAEEGDVVLTGFGEMESIEPGHYVQSAPGKPLITGAEAEALLLHIQWPEKTIRKENDIALEGRTLPNTGLSARVGGTEMELQADAEGRFEVKLKLEEGLNTVELSASDPLGRKVSHQKGFTVDSTPPKAQDVEVKYP